MQSQLRLLASKSGIPQKIWRKALSSSIVRGQNSRTNVNTTFSLGIPSTTAFASAMSTASPLEVARGKQAKDIERLVETVQAKAFVDWLNREEEPYDADAISEIEAAGISADDAKVLLRAAFMTFLVHVESRAASACGQGFYTIGPCGEELMGAVAMHIRPTDAMALHYRHVATQITRQLLAGRSVDEILLNRARGHTVAVTDPVTGGAHCAIGGGEYDFLVTSTLASQACPAVGRAMGSGMATYIKSNNPAMNPLFPKDMVSFVSVGDGSANNAHFLAALNLAEYAAHRKFKCPTVFCITDNEISISLKGYNYVAKSLLNKVQMPVYRADGKDALSISAATKQAMDYARAHGKPAMLYINNVTRRFGHAATDRQAAYLTAKEISDAAATNSIESLCKLLSRAGLMTYKEQQALLTQLWEETKTAFNLASAEPKISSREALAERISIPLAPVPAHYHPEQPVETSEKLVGYSSGPVLSDRSAFHNVQTRVGEQLGTPLAFPADHEVNNGAGVTRDVMRKHMTRVYDELMQAYPQAVYIGEDVMHGGYYLVSDGLAAKYPGRVRDFPPDETSLLGVGMGFAQNGLLPIVEIPYAKYLDCGFDMFTELAISSWLSDRKQPNGMFIRLQGFGKGVFGGNFHTHNTIYTPPGIDVVCYSNGRDYAMGTRYAMAQASKGRVVMSVDFTHLLNLRHVDVDDDMWRKPYTSSNEYLDFDTVRTYSDAAAGSGKHIAIVTYGEGVVTSLQARKKYHAEGGNANVTIIDCPLLNRVPEGLRRVFAEGKFGAALFVDPAKVGQNPMSGHLTQLQQEDLLPAKWRSVAAEFTYNPLGSTITFVSAEDILGQLNKLI